MGGVIVLGQAFEDVANKNGWALPHRGRKERNQHWDKIPGVRLGEFNYKQTNFQRFFYGDKLIIVHKCRQCGQNQDWPGTGNNYHEKFAAGEYFCPDAPSIFLPSRNNNT